MNIRTEISLANIRNVYPYISSFGALQSSDGSMITSQFTNTLPDSRTISIIYSRDNITQWTWHTSDYCDGIINACRNYDRTLTYAYSQVINYWRQLSTHPVPIRRHLGLTCLHKMELLCCNANKSINVVSERDIIFIAIRQNIFCTYSPDSLELIG